MSVGIFSDISAQRSLAKISNHFKMAADCIFFLMDWHNDVILKEIWARQTIPENSQSFYTMYIYKERGRQLKNVDCGMAFKPLTLSVIFFFVFSQESGVGISYKLSICMKCQLLFSEENQKKLFMSSAAKFTLHARR